ncbi:hypothetical protein JJD61_13635 [Pseudomonas carnis]|uniref:hypothetical protein n=1 Tax=Pseudomonas carnis TaxID=2487355 RepID=UPI00190A5695|nr:hypothetical protein [Pseudomonas carnis]MBK3471733.1 hypothetical protein [Pseudomonas carnis]
MTYLKTFAATMVAYTKNSSVTTRTDPAHNFRTFLNAPSEQLPITQNGMQKKGEQS